MKLLYRILGITIIGLLVIFVSIYFVNTNIIINELNNCSALAMSQTQKVMKEKMKKNLEFLDSNEFKDISYENYYINCFNSLVQNPNIYSLNVDGDDSKGIIYVEIDVNKYRLIPKKKLLNIINVEGEGLDDIESLLYEKTTSKVKTKPGKTFKALTPQTLGSWPTVPDEKLHTYNFDFIVYASVGTATDANSIAGPLIEVRCTDKNDNISVIATNEEGQGKMSEAKSSEDCNCKLLELVLPEGVVRSKYTKTYNTLTIYRTSLITEIKTTLKRKEGVELLDLVDLSVRYIDDINTLHENSIWVVNKEFRKVLESYLEKL